MLFMTKLKYVRVSPKKAFFIAKKVVGLKFSYAVQLLEFSNKKFARMLSKYLQNCINAMVDRNSVNLSDLVISNIVVTNGPMLRKYKYRARGCISKILKRTSHISMYIINKKV